MNKREKVIVGMSGGVDSSAALILLKKQGFEPIGISLDLGVWQGKRGEKFQQAKRVCKKYQVKHYIINAKREFKKTVVDYFVRELEKGRTPNPCMVCNPNLKFKLLFQLARKYKAQYVAMGHYSKIIKGQGARSKEQGRKHLLEKPKDKEKDQAYYLAFLPQRWLPRILFPLANKTKEQTYKLVAKAGFKFPREESSQDFCYLAGKDVSSFLKQEIGIKPGKIVDLQGNVLGQHQGMHFYTIGQRQGLNLPGGPYYVVQKDQKKNVLVVTTNQKELGRKEIRLSGVHFLSGQWPKRPLSVQAKIRYRTPVARATLYPLSKQKARLVFYRAQRAVTPGQFAVFYQGQVCLGGGEIGNKEDAKMFWEQ